MTWVSTFLYLEQQAFVAKVFHSTDERTRFFAGIDFCVQAASLTDPVPAVRAAVQVVRHARASRLGAAHHDGRATRSSRSTPVFMVLVVVYAVRRVADYAITRPCRDSLFTVVSREEKYQAKSLIDTFAYRGGDALSGSLYKALTGGFGATPAAIGWLGAGISAVWTVLALALGRAFQRRGARSTRAADRPRRTLPRSAAPGGVAGRRRYAAPRPRDDLGGASAKRSPRALASRRARKGW